MTDAEPRDPLTGLFHVWHERRFAPERAAAWLAVPPADTVFLAIALRGFKRVNDGHGMAVGDRVLAEAGRRIREAAGEWPAYRLGGDEFLVALRASDEQAIAGFARTIRGRLEAPYDGIVVRTWAAAGRMTPGETAEHLLQRTDRAMLTATRDQSSELVLAPLEE